MQFYLPFFFLRFFCGNCRKVLLDFLKEVKKMDVRILTQRQKIINALKEAGSEGMTNAELSKISLRYGGQLGALYRQGYKIEKRNLDGGLYNYILIAEPADIKYFKNANEEVFEEIEKSFNDLISSYDLENMLQEKHFHIIRKNGWYQNLY
jgi:hypothetical protein